MKPYETALAALIFVVINAIGIGTAFLLSEKLDAGDILSFEGAVLGAAGAVLGAIYVEDRKRRQQAEEELAPIRDALNSLHEALRAGADPILLADLRFSIVERAARVVGRIQQFYPPKSAPILLRWDHYSTAMASLQKSVEFARRHTIGAEESPPASDTLKHQHRKALEEVEALIAAYR